ncbi:hypothetical protein PPGU19_086920 (plasmid) [Paraburkholderia sp. PGU19]|uniref:hypothetical protein n=1 Tax=Paraburkholderia sp. PGU19 TaxID=2735434 RepID=UPI0015D9BD05|nr:hypothetical protein [Paraburkholderia sp. PGU19]BCG04124.1 hypothetical protein PPGU19_086920 [Paraburkholderia sp. PGU19]
MHEHTFRVGRGREPLVRLDAEVLGIELIEPDAGLREAGAAASATVLTMIAVRVFLETVRRYVGTMADDRKSWLRGLRDRLLRGHCPVAFAHGISELVRNVKPGRIAEGRGDTGRSSATVAQVRVLNEWHRKSNVCR